MMKNLYIIILLLALNGCKKSDDGTVEVIPLAPTELKGTIISKDQLDLTWKDNSTNETGYKIERKTDSGNFTEIGSTAADVTIFSDKTVSVNTNYTYRVYGFNQVGKSIQYSNEVSIQTINVPTLTTTAITDITSNGAKSGGNISSDGGSAITARGVVWGTSSNPTIAQNNKTSNGNGTGSFQSAITELAANTKYYVRSYATNSAGTSYGNEVSFTTLDLFYELNGIKCPNAKPGDKGTLNGKVYEAVDRALLIKRRDEGADLTCVCTTLVTDMSSLFAGSEQRRNTFNQQIGNWDVSNVTNTAYMFLNSDFNQSIDKWDVSGVKNMTDMFANAKSFNQPIGSWSVNNVNYTVGMFRDAGTFNQPIGSWNVGNVLNMYAMFHRASSFNQPIGSWDVSKVTNMSIMFGDTPFNQPIGNWNVSNVNDISFMFSGAREFNQPIGNWNVSKVTNMSALFQVAAKFNQPLKNWNVSNVIQMGWTFAYAGEFDQDISTWNVSKVKNMDRLFAFAWKFNSDISKWNVSNVELMNVMFAEAKIFNRNLSSWCVKNITSLPGDFSTNSALTNENKPKWGTCP